MSKPIYKLLDWIDINKLDIEFLSKNENAIAFLEQNPDLINWHYLSGNKNAEELLLANKNKIKLNRSNIGLNENLKIIDEIIKPNINIISNNQLSLNKNTVKLLVDKYPEKINWALLSLNTSDEAMEYLEINQEKICWFNLSLNTNDKAIKILINNQDKIQWALFSSNSNTKAVELLLKNLDKINWCYLSKNSNDKAVELLLKNQSKIDWNRFSLNTNDKAIDLLLKNPDKINWVLLLVENYNPRIIDIIKNNLDKLGELEWCLLSENPYIFKLDYYKMTENFMKLKEEIITEAMNPKRICKYLEIENYDYFEEMYGY